MKNLFIILACFVITIVACDKEDECFEATITQKGTPCPSWSINAGTTTYISDNIPDQFKQEGLEVCVKYELYEDMRMCVCCGGTRANIISMSLPED